MITGLMSMVPEDISNMMMSMMPETVTNNLMTQFNLVLSSINVALDEILTSFGSKFFLKFDFSFIY